LIYRLFHERGVRVFRGHPVEAKCSCSRDRITDMLGRFSQDDRDHMVENGVISVTCEFCSQTYVVQPSELEAAS
jgi:molecular chaperone Hsp33